MQGRKEKNQNPWQGYESSDQERNHLVTAEGEWKKCSNMLHVDDETLSCNNESDSSSCLLDHESDKSAKKLFRM